MAIGIEWNGGKQHIYIYIYTYIYFSLFLYLYIYIYIYLSLSLYIYIYIYIYIIHTYKHLLTHSWGAAMSRRRRRKDRVARGETHESSETAGRRLRHIAK